MLYALTGQVISSKVSPIFNLSSSLSGDSVGESVTMRLAPPWSQFAVRRCLLSSWEELAVGGGSELLVNPSSWPCGRGAVLRVAFVP